jgi:hypothetical protein
VKERRGDEVGEGRGGRGGRRNGRRMKGDMEGRKG